MSSKTQKKSSKKTSKKASKKIKIYCGIKDPIPSNNRLGSMEECLNKNKVNYYGIKKIDSRLLESKKKEKEELENKKLINKLRIEISGFVGKETKLKKDLSNAKTVESKNKIIKDIEKVRLDKSKLIQKLNKIIDKKN
jgi:hypothetical protein